MRGWQRASFVLLVALAACRDNMFTGNLTPVPPVHRLPADVGKPVILLDTDPLIETKDPNHVARANEKRVPQQYREAMASAFELGGFRVTSNAGTRHDLIAKLAIAVSEEGENVRQVYRCGLLAPDGTTPVAQIDWTWPQGTFVGEYEVLDFATHNVATEVVRSRRVLTYLRRHPPPDPDAGTDAGSDDAASDAGADASD